MDSHALPESLTQGAIQHMNADHQHSLLFYARQLAGCDWAEKATMITLDTVGFELAVIGNGRQETHYIPFPTPVMDVQGLRATLIALAQPAASSTRSQRAATARVATTKASRYLKALCNHFDRKATASYADHHGRVQFSFGECEFQADDMALLIRVSADSEAMLTRVKYVVADHLERFGANENLRVGWNEATV